MAIIAKYKFDSNLYADYLPTFNAEFTGYTKTDVDNSDGTITRTISHDALKPTVMRFGTNGEATDREKSLLEVMECDTSNMTSMFAMFQNCLSLTFLNTSNFNTDNITNISSMFSGCSKLTSLNLSSFNTSNVTNMNSMFNSCNKLTSLDISSFNTSKVTNMNYMFFNCSSLTSLDLSNFNTSQVTNMSNMFNSCNKLISLDLSNFDTSQSTRMSNMFDNCSSLTSLDLSNFNTNSVTRMDGMFQNCSSLTSLDLSNFNTSQVTNMSNMFYSCNKLTSLDISSFNTSKVTNMNYMFQNCSSLTSLDLSNFNTSQVTNMSNMFNSCNKLISLDLSNFDTNSVTRMDSMFKNCSSLTSLDLSSFDTSRVDTMGSMFDFCPSLTSLDLSKFNTSKVTNMWGMFNGCSLLTSLDLSSFDTSKVTDMAWMFNACNKLISLDLSNFNTDGVTSSIEYIFNQCPVPDIGLLYATSSTINSLLTPLGTDVARNIYYTDAALSELTVQDNITYIKYELTKATLPYTLNKLPNGVADYIDVVNKVHVQRVGVIEDASTLNWATWIDSPLENGTARFVGHIGIKYLPDGATINGAKFMSDKLKPMTSMNDDLAIYSISDLVFVTFLRLTDNTLNDFKARMSELKPKILYELATPIYTPLTEEEIAQLPLSAYADGYVNLSSDQLTPSFEFRMRASNRYQIDMLETGYYYLNAPVGNVKLGTANVNVQQMPCIVKVDNVGTGNSGYRLGFSGEVLDTTKITLAKLPSHRIPTTFTQGMKCGTDFGYWEGIKESAWKGIRLTGETGDGSLRSADNNIRYLNRLEGNYQGNIIVEDEFDFGTGKLTKRIGKVVLDGSVFVYDTQSIGEEYTSMTIFGDRIGVNFKNSFSGNYGFAMSDIVTFGVNYSGEYNHMYTRDNNLMIIMKTNELGTPTKEGIVKYFEAKPMTVYYELTVPEISYVDVSSHEGKTINNKTKLETNYYIATTYLQPQIKPSHLTYPVPSLVGNRTYTVVHNRKNITGSTKPIELNLGGTVVQLNDASSKTLVKTPSTLAHSNLIFIGGESTVDHIMVLDGDWTNKPIEYFENMKGHDTDAIITIIGDGKIDDVAEQYLW